jgi:DNA-binding NtrC family response regulator
MGKKILLVEDDRDLIEEVTPRAKEAGLELTLARDLEAAGKQAAAVKPEYIVIDMTPPEEGAVKAFKELKGAAGEGVKFVVVMGMGKVDSMHYLKLKRAGVCDSSIEAATYDELVEAFKTLS